MFAFLGCIPEVTKLAVYSQLPFVQSLPCGSGIVGNHNRSIHTQADVEDTTAANTKTWAKMATGFVGAEGAKLNFVYSDRAL